MANFLDEHGLNTLWTKLKGTFVSFSRTINGKALSNDVTLNYSDVGAQAAMLTVDGSASGSGSANFTINYTFPSLALGQFARINSVVFTATSTKTTYGNITATCNIKLPSGGKYIILGSMIDSCEDSDEAEHRREATDTIVFPTLSSSFTDSNYSSRRALFSTELDYYYRQSGNTSGYGTITNNLIISGGTTIHSEAISIPRNTTKTLSYTNRNYILWRLA